MIFAEKVVFQARPLRQPKILELARILTGASCPAECAANCAAVWRIFWVSSQLQ